jgi:cytochrome c
MDTMTFTKAAGALCGALLVFLLGKWAAEELYHVGGHGEQAYVIETDEGGDEAAQEEESGPGIMEVMASADPDAGANVFRQCQACHKLEEGANATGPYLYGVVGRDIAAASGFGYSDALSGKEGEWTVENLSAFLENPKGWAPGTIMGYAGLRDIEDRADVIAYLDASDGDMLDYAALASEAASAGGDASASEEASAEGEGDAAGAEEAAAEGDANAATEEESASTEESAATEEEQAAASEEEQDAASEEEEAAAGETETGDQDEAAAGGGDGAILANADPEAGERVFRKCQACHKVNGQDGVGPHLNGVVGREIASAEGFNYSDALSGKEGVWDAATLDAFLANPREWAPGTKMSFAGLNKEDERANVIAYLNNTDG